MVRTLFVFKYFFVLKKGQIVEDTFRNTQVDDLMDQVVVQVICSIGTPSMKLFKLMKIPFVMNHCYERDIPILFRLYDKRLKIEI